MAHEITIYTSDYPFLEEDDIENFSDHIVEYLNTTEVIAISITPVPENDERCDFDCSYCHMEEY